MFQTNPEVATSRYKQEDKFKVSILTLTKYSKPINFARKTFHQLQRALIGEHERYSNLYCIGKDLFNQMQRMLHLAKVLSRWKQMTDGAKPFHSLRIPPPPTPLG